MKSFFHSADFYSLRRDYPYWHFEKQGTHIRFYQIDNQWINLPKATFGGMSYAKNNFSMHIAIQLLNETVLEAKAQNVKELKVILPPRFYDPDGYDCQIDCLSQIGFRELFKDRNFQIPVSKKSFYDSINSSERYRLRKAHAAECYFSILENTSWPIEKVFELIQISRLRRGYPVGISSNDLEIMQRCPAYLVATVCNNQGEVIALALCIKTLEDVLYTFMTADNAAYRQYSPVVLLHEGLYHYCQNENYTYLDLGTCGAKGILNHGVAAFKRHLGADECEKSTWILPLSVD